MATQNIPVSGGRTSGGSSYTPEIPTGTASSGFDETLQRELAGTNAAGTPVGSVGATGFGTQSHFAGLNLANLQASMKFSNTGAELGLQSAGGNALREIREEAPQEWGQAKTVGYQVGDKGFAGFKIPGQKDTAGFYNVDNSGKLQGLSFEDTSWKSAGPVLAMLLGPLAGTLAPGLSGSIAGATGLSPTLSNILARGLLGGGVSTVTGGKFGTGFLGGAVTAGLNPAIRGVADTIGGQGTAASALLNAGGRLGVSAALSGGRITPTAVVGTLLDSFGKPRAAGRTR